MQEKEKLPATDDQLEEIAKWLKKDVKDLTKQEVEETGGQASEEEQQQKESS